MNTFFEYCLWFSISFIYLLVEEHSICETLILNVAPVVVVAMVKARVVAEVVLGFSTYTKMINENFQRLEESQKIFI